MNNLALRALTAFAGAAVIITSVVWNEYTYCLLFLALTIALHAEFIRLCNHIEGFSSPGIHTFTFITLGILIQLAVIGTITGRLEIMLWPFLIPAFSLVFISELWRKNEKPLLHAGIQLTAFLYIVLPVSLLYVLTLHNGFSGITTLIMLLMIWTNDTMAYFTGMAIGKHKLFERISPKKTWEGFFGGMVFTIASSFVIHIWYTEMTIPELAGMALIVVIFGTAGDLVESMFKRSIHIKDSGTILPGHGGFLDRFDAFLLATPFVVAYLVLLGKW